MLLTLVHCGAAYFFEGSGCVASFSRGSHIGLGVSSMADTNRWGCRSIRLVSQDSEKYRQGLEAVSLNGLQEIANDPFSGFRIMQSGKRGGFP